MAAEKIDLEDLVLLACPICGAVVRAGEQDQHASWHASHGEP